MDGLTEPAHDALSSEQPSPVDVQTRRVAALVFELSKVETPAIRERMLSRLVNVDSELAKRVATGLGLDSVPPAAPTSVAPKKNIKPSPALSLLAKAKNTLEGRQIGCLIGDGTDPALLLAVRQAVEGAKAKLVVIAPKVAGVTLGRGKRLDADHALNAAPSVLFDAVLLLLTDPSANALSKEAAAIDFVRDAFGHLKVIGHTSGAAALLTQAGIGSDADRGVVAVDAARDAAAFVSQAKQGKVWEREPKLRTVY